MTRIAAGKFKDQCLEVLERVAATRKPVTITKRGKPVAMLVPCRSSPAKTASLAGSILKERGNPVGTGQSWNADGPAKAGHYRYRAARGTSG